MARIIKNDTVIVVTGKDKGKEGKVIRVFPKSDKALVQGINMMFKHVRKSQDHPQGARIQKEMPLHISNLMLKDPKTGEPTRIKYQIDPSIKGKDKKVRISKKSGEVIEKSNK